MSWEKHVFPHGDIKPLGENTWYVRGQLPGGRPPRTMAIHRLKNGDLVIHSAIALSESGMEKLAGLGTVRYVIVPNRMHRLDSGVYQARFPAAKFLCPKVAQSAVEKVVKLDGNVEDVLPPLGIDCRRIPGLKPFELAYEFPSDGGKVLVVCDALFNLPHAGFLLNLIGSSGFFGITRIGRWLMLADRAEFKAWLIAESKRRDLRAISVAHGDPVVGNVSEKLAAAAARL